MVVTQSKAHSHHQTQIFSNSGEISGKSKYQFFLLLSNFARLLCSLPNVFFFGVVGLVKRYTAVIDIRLIRLELVIASHFPRFSVKLIKNKDDYEKNIHHMQFENGNEHLIINFKGLGSVPYKKVSHPQIPRSP